MKIKTRKIKNLLLSFLGKTILLVFALTCITSVPAFGVDFITKKKFDSDKSVYKDYPLKILFKKLKASKGLEKRKIINTIILKQVFDPDMQAKVQAGVIEYKKTFGIIKEISKDHLKAWVPETEGHVDFYLGIDQIPLINDHNYQVGQSNIGRYAAIIYSLDNRVYQIKISFLPATPTGLYVKRENNKNIVGWNQPSAIRKPYGYKVLINDEPFEQVKETVVKVPRTSGQVDEYTVKALYKHGSSFIDSEASDIQVDQITAKEIQQELLAWETYDRIIIALNPSQWQDAEKLLYDNQQLLSQNLNLERKQNTDQLVAFFREIDEGDRLSKITPESIQKSESAVMFYRRAEKKAKALPADIDVAFIPRLKINESQERIAQLQTQQNQLLAAVAYERIITSLNPSQWQTAETLLYDKQQFLNENLDDEHKLNTRDLIAFFREIDEGDRLSSATPESIQNIESALMFYQRAEQKAKALPAGIDVAFITRLKIGESQERIARLQTQQEQLLAVATYDRIITALNPSEWQTAETLLYDKQQFLNQQLDAERKQNTDQLVAFFKEIDEGDRLGKATPESIKNIESALMYYQRAGQTAKALPAGIDVAFIPRLKIDESKGRLARLQSQQKQLSADETYERIIAALNPAQWQTAEILLFENQQFLNKHLDAERKQNTDQLIVFFKEIDEGDRLGQATPESIQKLESALMFYQRAEQKAKALPAAIDVQFIPRLKIDESKGRIARLQTRQKQLLAVASYDRIIAALNPSEWQTAEKLLYDNQQFLDQHLDQKRKQNTAGLTAFFMEIDEGDRLGQAAQESIQNLESALMFYQRAEQKAKALPAGIDVQFIPRLKIDESKGRIARLQSQQKQLSADETYERIIAALNPSGWQTAEKLLYDKQQFLSEHLDKERKQNTDQLIAFFKEIDEGDRLGQATPESIQKLESALMFYQRAEKKAQALPTAIDVQFIPRLKIDASQGRIARLQTQQKELLAAETYDRIVAALNPSDWQTAEKRLYDNQQFLDQHLDQKRKQNTAGLAAFFMEIDEGDRLGQATPESIQNLESALMFYQRAEKKAQALPAAIDVQFIPRLKIDESQGRIARLQTQQKELLATETYDRIITAINPSQWQDAEKLLFENQQFLDQHLDQERKQNTVGLIAFFREVDEGDRLSQSSPESIQNLESALMFYQRAEQKAQALPAAIDVVFIPRLKINASKGRIAELQAQEKQLLAVQTYDRIITALNPSQWQDAERLLYENQQFLNQHLTGERPQNIIGLVAFFSEIDAGDRFSNATPESIHNQESALTFYQRAEQKAQALPADIDVAFILRIKIDESQGRLDKLRASEQEFVAARSAKTESMPPPEKPKSTFKKLAPKRAVKVAMKDFRTRKYDSSFKHFETAYSSQIAKLKQSGRKRIGGFLSLPTKHRAEVVFLLELDRLKRKTDNDEELIREGLQELYDTIDNGAGLWSIIPESKRRKIKRHIEKY